MALSPMKWQRCSTFTPGQAVSTMNAVICRFSFPLTVFDGVRAMTTISSALVPLVHHSFSPFRIHACPSSLGRAMVSIAAGSDPTPGSVSANAEMAPLASSGRYFFFCASEPNILSGWGTPSDWCAARSAEVEPQPAQEQIAHEAGRGPLLLARGLGDFARLVGADLALRSRDGSGHGYLLP